MTRNQLFLDIYAANKNGCYTYLCLNLCFSKKPLISTGAMLLVQFKI